jgi:hypothetical protein
MSVTVPVVVPLITIEAPGRVSFVSEVETVPLIGRTCPIELKPSIRKNRNSHTDFPPAIRRSLIVNLLIAYLFAMIKNLYFPLEIKKLNLAS